MTDVDFEHEKGTQLGAFFVLSQRDTELRIHSPPLSIDNSSVLGLIRPIYCPKNHFTMKV